MQKISVCIPTYNNEKTLDECLGFIASQDYPKDLVEVIIIDGGSSDSTLEIAKKYTNILLNNEKRAEEYARTIGVEKSSGGIIAFVDADNFLINRDTLKIVYSCFLDNPEIVFCEPIYYESRITDDNITKYISLIGGDDPVAVYLGIYDRFSYLKNDWTDSRYEVIKKSKNYSTFKLLNIQNMPPLGANVCFIKKDALLEINYKPFLHTDVIFRLLKRNNYFAKINLGVVHKQNGLIKTFLKKKMRRLNRKYSDLNREYYFQLSLKNVIFLVLRLIFIFPLIIDAIIGYTRKKDRVWLFHPLLTYLSSAVYIYSLMF